MRYRPRYLSPIHCLLSMALACMSFLASAAGGRIHIQAPASLDPSAQVVDDVKAECGIERSLSEQAFERIRESVAGVRQTALEDRVATEPFLKLTILYVYATSGGSWSGPKSIGLRADLLLKDEVVATQEFRQSSMGGLAGPFSGTCAIIERITKGLGEELAEWLPSVTETQPAPKSSAPKPAGGTAATVRKRHRGSEPETTGHAAIKNFDALPLREEGKNRYQHYLTLPAPKAFAISESGGWRFLADNADAITKTLDVCVEQLKSPCWLYAVDDRVVWAADVNKRVGKAVPPEASASRPARAIQAKPPASAVEAGASATVAQRPAAHRLPMPDATGFANGEEVEAVPVRAAGKLRYQEYLGSPSPKAFVIYADGTWAFHWNNPDVMSQLLNYCARQGKLCWLYAVDNQVVWNADIEKRIGSSSQLKPK